MILIRTAEAMTLAIETSPDPELRSLLTQHAERLEGYSFEEVAEFMIVQPGDTLDERLVAEGRFAFPVEIIAEHTNWFEVVWIMSDDGYGLVLLIEKAATDTHALAACRHALLDAPAA
jgi:hypothetical protein